MTSRNQCRWSRLGYGLLCGLLVAACGVEQGALTELESPVARQHVTPMSQPVEIQAMTVDANGQLLRGPFGSNLCSYQHAGGKLFAWPDPINNPVLINMVYAWECTSVPAAPPGYNDPPEYYNGGSVDVWLSSAAGDSLLGHIKAKYEKLVLHHLPVGATLRLRASPNSDPAPGVLFNHWTGSQGFSTSTELLVTVQGGEYFLAEFQMPKPPNGSGGDPGGPPCIICP